MAISRHSTTCMRREDDESGIKLKINKLKSLYKYVKRVTLLPARDVTQGRINQLSKHDYRNLCEEEEKEEEEEGG